MNLFILWEKLIFAFSEKETKPEQTLPMGDEAPILVQDDLEQDVATIRSNGHLHSADIPYLPLEEYAAEKHRLELGIEVSVQHETTEESTNPEQVSPHHIHFENNPPIQQEEALGGGAKFDALVQNYSSFARLDLSEIDHFRLFPEARQVLFEDDNQPASIKASVDAIKTTVFTRITSFRESLLENLSHASEYKEEAHIVEEKSILTKHNVNDTIRSESDDQPVCKDSTHFALQAEKTDLNVNDNPVVSISYEVGEGDRTIEAHDELAVSIQDTSKCTFIDLDSISVMESDAGEVPINHFLGSGNSDLVLGNEEGNVILGQGGDDFIVGMGGDDVLVGGRGDDIVLGETGDDYLFGDSGNDLMSGGRGSDQLWGGFGDDFMLGDAGSDFLWGGKGSDFLFGGDGDDYISGGEGADLMCGGFGNDVYVFNTLNSGVDMILFEDNPWGSDRLQFSADVFTVNHAWTFDSGLFHGEYNGTAPQNGTNTAAFIYDQDSGNLWHDANGSEDGGETLIANIIGDDLEQDDIIVC